MADLEMPVPAEDAPESETDTAQRAEYLNLQEAMQEYSEMMSMMPQYVRDVTKKMSMMRAEGIPDRAAYEKLRADLTQVYDRFRDVSQRMIDFQEGVQDSYITALEKDTEWHAAQEMDQYGRREGDHAPYTERKTPLELYDEEVVKLLADAIELEELGKFYDKNGTSEKNRPQVRAAMMGILEKLKELDDNREGQEQSRERESLIDLLGKLDERYPAEQKAVAAASPLVGIREAHRQVKAEYVAVQHTLTDGQRREMRTRIAQLSGLVRQAEDDAWVRTFAPPPPPEPPAPEKVSEQKDIKPAILFAMSRAVTIAPVIADAVVPPLPKKGMFAALGAAFKLK